MKLVISETVNDIPVVTEKETTLVISEFDTSGGAIPLSTITAKGGLIVGTGAGAVAQLPVGTNGQVPVAATGETTGIKWQTLSTLTKEWGGTISNPQAIYAQRAQLFVAKTIAAVTITSILVDCNDPTPTAEIAGDLKFADDMSDGVFANATVIATCDTTNGTKLITSGFNDATIPSGKYVYFLFDASPHADVKDILLQVLYTFD